MSRGQVAQRLFATVTCIFTGDEVDAHGRVLVHTLHPASAELDWFRIPLPTPQCEIARFLSRVC